MDPLQRLIKSLSPSEKRYCSIFAAAFKEESDLMKLFAAIDEAGDDSSQIEIKGIKNITKTRSGLRKLILRAMRNYHEDDSTKSQIRNTINEAEFLINKGLFEEARKELYKTLKIAESNRAYVYVSEIKDHLYNISSITQKHDKFTEDFDLLTHEMDDLLHLQGEVYFASMINRQVRLKLLETQNISVEAQKQYMDATALLIEERLTSVRSDLARVLYYSVLGFIKSTYTSIEAAIEQYAHAEAMYLADPSLIHSDPAFYLAFLNNYASMACYYPQHKEVSLRLINETEKSFVTLKQYFQAAPEKYISFFIRLTTKKLTYVKTNHEWQMLPALEKEVKQNISIEKRNEKILIALQIASLISCYMIKQDYEKAIEWCGIYYMQEDPKMLRPLMICVRIMEAIVYYADKQYDVSDVKCMNLYKTLIDQEMTDDFHKNLSTLLRKLNKWNLANVKDRDELQMVIDKFDLLRINKDGHYNMYKDLFDPVSILKSIMPKMPASKAKSPHG